MKEQKEETLFSEQTGHDMQMRGIKEKALLWPILKALGVERKKWEKFKYFPDQLIGLAIACIKERDRQIKNLGKQLVSLQHAYAKVCQQEMNFKGCPFDPREKT